MAITAGKQPRKLADGCQDYAGGKADDVVFAGGIVMIDASGRAINGAAATGSIGVGIATTNKGIDRFDSTGLADGVTKVRWEEGIFCVKNSGSTPFLSSDQPGLIAYIEDNETVCKTGTGKSPAGLFHHLDADGVWVEMGKKVGATALVLTTATDLSAAHLAGSETVTGVKTFASGADPLFAKEAAHTLKVADTTTAATAGGALTIAAGKSGTTGAGGALNLVGGAGTTNAAGGAINVDAGAKNGSGVDGLIGIGLNAGSFIKLGKKLQATASANTISDPGTGVAIPVTASGVVAITTNGTETNTLADPTFMGQTLDVVLDTDTSGARTITAASRINKAGSTHIILTDAGDYCRLVAVTIAGALKWQVLGYDGALFS